MPASFATGPRGRQRTKLRIAGCGGDGTGTPTLYIYRGVALIKDGGGGCSDHRRRRFRFHKAGLAGDDAPRVFPNLFSHRIKLEKSGARATAAWQIGDQYWIGEPPGDAPNSLERCHPIEHGHVTNWGMMELVWQHTYSNELRVDPGERAFMLTEPPLNQKDNRARMTQVHFESFNVPHFNVQLSGTLALFAAGRTTGCVCDSGEGVSHTVPICEKL